MSNPPVPSVPEKEGLPNAGGPSSETKPPEVAVRVIKLVLVLLAGAMPFVCMAVTDTWPI